MLVQVERRQHQIVGHGSGLASLAETQQNVRELSSLLVLGGEADDGGRAADDRSSR